MTLGVTLKKDYQVADWRIRPLPQEMVDYARYDSHYLIAIYASMMKMLAPALFFNEGQSPLSLETVLNESIKQNSESSTNWV